MNRKSRPKKLQNKSSRPQRLTGNAIIALLVAIVSELLFSIISNQITNTTKPNGRTEITNNSVVEDIFPAAVSIIHLLAYIVAAIAVLFFIYAAFLILTKGDLSQDSDHPKIKLSAKPIDVRIIERLEHIFPKEISDELIGDLREKRQHLLRSGIPRWIVFARTLGWQMNLVWAYFQIQSRQNISQWLTHISKIFFT
jgi:hypothetical protein